MFQKKHSDEYYFGLAAEEAKKSLCLKAKCGAIVVRSHKVIGRGYNAPPNDDIGNATCNFSYHSTQKLKYDKTCCMHAEWRAIIDALKHEDVSSGVLYFVRVKNKGEILKSGRPYCTVCSRFALDLGMLSFGLWHEEGITMSPIKEYNRLSYSFHLGN